MWNEEIVKLKIEINTNKTTAINNKKAGVIESFCTLQDKYQSHTIHVRSNILTYNTVMVPSWW